MCVAGDRPGVDDCPPRMTRATRVHHASLLYGCTLRVRQRESDFVKGFTTRVPAPGVCVCVHVRGIGAHTFHIMMCLSAGVGAQTFTAFITELAPSDIRAAEDCVNFERIAFYAAQLTLHTNVMCSLLSSGLAPACLRINVACYAILRHDTCVLRRLIAPRT